MVVGNNTCDALPNADDDKPGLHLSDDCLTYVTCFDCVELLPVASGASISLHFCKSKHQSVVLACLLQPHFNRSANLRHGAGLGKHI